MKLVAFIILNLIMFSIVFIFTYLFTGIWVWEFNIGEWSDASRHNFLIINLFFDIVMFLFCFYAFSNDGDGPGLPGLPI